VKYDCGYYQKIPTIKMSLSPLESIYLSGQDHFSVQGTSFER